MENACHQITGQKTTQKQKVTSFVLWCISQCAPIAGMEVKEHSETSVSLKRRTGAILKIVSKPSSDNERTDKKSNFDCLLFYVKECDLLHEGECIPSDDGPYDSSEAQCDIVCPLVYQPVCAVCPEVGEQTFQNDCDLNAFNACNQERESKIPNLGTNRAAVSFSSFIPFIEACLRLLDGESEPSADEPRGPKPSSSWPSGLLRPISGRVIPNQLIPGHTLSSTSSMFKRMSTIQSQATRFSARCSINSLLN